MVSESLKLTFNLLAAFNWLLEYPSQWRSQISQCGGGLAGSEGGAYSRRRPLGVWKRSP